MFHVVLYEPEIPPNTGNIIRLCANTGCQLHLIEPLGFDMDDKQLQRAGLDYREYVTVQRHTDFASFLTQVEPKRVFGFSTRGQRLYNNVDFAIDDALVFGPETRGLPHDVFDALPATQRLRLPMLPQNRSLNLSNTVAIVVYEAWRQLGFAGGQ